MEFYSSEMENRESLMSYFYRIIWPLCGEHRVKRARGKQNDEQLNCMNSLLRDDNGLYQGVGGGGEK